MAYINETNLNNWIDKINCYLQDEPFIGAKNEDINNDLVDPNKVGSANKQVTDLASRSNYLKEEIAKINLQITSTPTANKLLLLNNDAKNIANIDNDDIITKKITIDSDNESYLKKIKTNNLISKKYIWSDTNITNHNIFIETTNNNINLLQFNGNAGTTTKLLNPITIADTGTDSNISLSVTNIDLSSNFNIVANLKDYNTTKTIDGTIAVDTDPDNPVFYAYRLTKDGRIKTAWNKISPDAIVENTSKKFVTDAQTETWDNKVDNTFIPNKLLNWDTDLTTTIDTTTTSYIVSNIIKTTANNTDKISKAVLEFHSSDKFGKEKINFEIEKPTIGAPKILIAGDIQNLELFGTHNFIPNNYATLNSPVFTGSPEVPNTTININSTSKLIANVNYVNSAIKASEELRWQQTQNLLDELLRKKFHMYNPKEYIIYDDIFTAYKNEVITKGSANPGFNDTSYKTTKWFNKKMICFGNTSDHNFYVRVPTNKNYNTVWLRVTNDRWNVFGVRSDPFDKTKYNVFTAGNRNLINMAPDGGLPDGTQWRHKWVPIRLDEYIFNKAEDNYKEYQIFGGNKIAANNAVGDTWISGIAFSTNPWNHNSVSALGIHWKVNGGDDLNWSTHDWNRDNLAFFPANTSKNFYLPAVTQLNGLDKLIYFIGHNDNWQNGIIKSIKINDIEIERIRTTYDNPFARHFNSAMYSNYLAARIPANVFYGALSSGKIKVTVDTTDSDTSFYFREIGIHDYFP